MGDGGFGPDADSHASEADNLLPNSSSPGADGDGADHGRQRWDSPPVNKYRYISVNLSFFIMGMHDGCIGASVSATAFGTRSLLTAPRAHA